MAAAAASSATTSFWDRVEHTESTYDPEAPIILSNKKVADNAKEFQLKMFKDCTGSNPLVFEFWENPPKKILDLGSGVGANTRPMIQKSHVTAIDSSRELLETFSKYCNDRGFSRENIRLRRGDITTMASYGEGFDLVVAVDVLPYVHPTTLRSTMQKIHHCLADKGILVGTIFTTQQDPQLRTFMGKLGAHFYSGGLEFAVQLIQESGFRIEKFQIDGEGAGSIGFKAIKIET